MKIFVAQNPTEAHIVCGLLRQEHIPCEVRGETLFGVRGEIPFDDSSAPYVWLLSPQYESQSKELIQAYLKAPTEKLSEWLCENCGENNESQFGLCWNCGARAS